MNKILYILEDGRFGGMNKMASDLAVEIQKYGFEPFFIVGKQNSNFFLSKLNKQNLPYKTIHLHVLSKSVKAILTYLFFFIPDIIKLIASIRTSQVEYVYCNGSQQIKGVIAASLLKKNVIWHIHDTYQPPLLLLVFKTIKSAFNVQYFIASSKRTISFYELNSSTTHVSLPPVNSTEFVRSSYENFPSKIKTTVITVCNINTDKGLDTLIETVAIINKTKTEIDFKIIGLLPDTQKDYYNSLLALIQKHNISNISFLGQRDDIYSQLASSDLYLCTSNNESGPISVFEAMSMEIPVVSTDVGDLKYIFDKYKCGTVQPVGDSVSIAKEVVSILTDSEKWNILSKNVREAVIQSIDISICAKKQVEFFYKISKKP